MAYGILCKTQKIGSTRGAPFKESSPTTYYNRKHLNGWAKIPIPKQIEDEHTEKELKNNKCPRKGKVLGHRLGRNAMYLK